MSGGGTTLGVVLAGGASRRMGERDKVLERFGQTTLLRRAVARLAPQVDRVIVNGPRALADHCDVEVVEDSVPGRAGPLAGALAAMEIAQRNPHRHRRCRHALLPARPRARLSEAEVAIARSDGRLHPVFARWPVQAAAALGQFLEGGDRKIMLFAERLGYRAIDFPPDPTLFFNVNTPDELAEARAMLERAA